MCCEVRVEHNSYSHRHSTSLLFSFCIIFRLHERWLLFVKILAKFLLTLLFKKVGAVTFLSLP